MTQLNFYHVLGITPEASRAEMHAAYARLVKLHHPDVAGSLPERLEEVQQAYRCLADSEARIRHDRSIAAHERQHFRRQERVQRRLSRYDRRHPPSNALFVRHQTWRSVVLVSVAAVAIVGLLIGLVL